MVPALLLLVQTALAASPAAPGHAAPLPSEKQLRSEAASWVAALCSTGPKDKCAAAREALSGYERLLPQTARCEAGPCSQAQLDALAGPLAKLDSAAAGLPAVKGRAINSLLRLGALGGVRLAAAAARFHSCLAMLGGLDDPGMAATAVEQICLESPGAACERARKILEQARAEAGEVAACAASPCPFARIDALAQAAQENLSRSLGAMPGVKTDTLPLFVLADKQLKGASTLLAKLVDDETRSLVRAGDAYEKRVAAAEKDSSADARALPGQAQTLMASYQEASYAADRLEQLMGYDKTTGAKRDAINTQTRRLGALRSRAFAAVTTRSFGGLPVEQALAAVGVPAPSGPGKLKPGVVLTTAKPTLLDQRALPPPTGAGPPPPPIMPGSPGLLADAKNLRSKNPLVQADAERRLGLSRTVGSPGTYAPYVYEQAANNTCAVAAQVEALRAMGMLPRGVKPEVQEKEAADALAKKAYFEGGTMPEYAGELLISKGLLVEKHVTAGWPELEAAIRRGALIQAAIDARGIWGMEKFPRKMTHSILITGGEVEKLSGRLLGVYINDSGDSPPRGGRFITTDTLKSVWQDTFVEVVR